MPADVASARMTYLANEIVGGSLISYQRLLHRNTLTLGRSRHITRDDFPRSRSLRSREEASRPQFAGRLPPCVKAYPPRKANVESFRPSDLPRSALATTQEISSGVAPLFHHFREPPQKLDP